MMKGREARAARYSNAANGSGKWRRIAVLTIVVCLLGALTIGGTLAFLTTRTNPVENQFTPSEVTCEVYETFANNQKTSIQVKNTGNTDAYVRVRLVTYRVNEAGDRIGGLAEIAPLTLTSEWEKVGNYYYCKTPVEPGVTSPEMLYVNDTITLQVYDDADGGKQVVEVIAEAIQSEPARTVQNAWVPFPGGN